MLSQDRRELPPPSLVLQRCHQLYFLVMLLMLLSSVVRFDHPLLSLFCSTRGCCGSSIPLAVRSARCSRHDLDLDLALDFVVQPPTASKQDQNE